MLLSKVDIFYLLAEREVYHDEVLKNLKNKIVTDVKPEAISPPGFFY